MVVETRQMRRTQSFTIELPPIPEEISSSSTSIYLPSSSSNYSSTLEMSHRRKAQTSSTDFSQSSDHPGSSQSSERSSNSRSRSFLRRTLGCIGFSRAHVDRSQSVPASAMRSLSQTQSTQSTTSPLAAVATSATLPSPAAATSNAVVNESVSAASVVSETIATATLTSTLSLLPSQAVSPTAPPSSSSIHSRRLFRIGFVIALIALMFGFFGGCYAIFHIFIVYINPSDLELEDLLVMYLRSLKRGNKK